MNCKKISKLLPLYAGGDLPGWKQLYTRFHLHRCETCCLELDRLKKTNRLFTSALEQKEIKMQTPEMWEIIRNQLPETPKQSGEKNVLILSNLIPIASK